MTTMTQLFKIVSSNDYDTLEKLIMGNKKLNFNCIKSHTSLISKAIEVRALECFNLLMSLNDLSILQSNNTYVNGLTIALEYYSSAPNPSNKYYLDKLIERNVTIDCWSLVKCMNDQLLFDNMFNRLDKSYNNIHNLISSAVQRNNVTVMSKLYDYLYLNNPTYYSTPENRCAFNEIILKTAIQSNNIIAIEHLENLEHNIMNLNQNNFQKMPSLYYAYVSNTDSNAFNFIFSRMEKMDENTLNLIQNIKKLSNIICSQQYYYGINCTKNSIECFKKILLLPIDWEDLADVISNIHNAIYRSIGSYYYDSKKILNQLDEKINFIYMVLKTNKIKSNPYNKIYLTKTEMIANITATINRLNGNQELIADFKSKIRKIKYVLNNFGFKDPDSLADHFKLVFKENESTTYETEKLNFIKEMEEWYTGADEKKSKAKVSRKKKTVAPVEIDV
jgi:hypothetical protein